MADIYINGTLQKAPVTLGQQLDSNVKVLRFMLPTDAEAGIPLSALILSMKFSLPDEMSWLTPTLTYVANSGKPYVEWELERGVLQYKGYGFVQVLAGNGDTTIVWNSERVKTYVHESINAVNPLPAITPDWAAMLAANTNTETVAARGGMVSLSERLLSLPIVVRASGGDDRDRLNAAFATGARCVVLPDANYTVSGYVDISASHITIMGLSPNQITISAPQGASVFRVKPDMTDVVFENLYIKGVPMGYPTYGNDNGGASTYGIRFDENTIGITVRKCTIDGFTFGIYGLNRNTDVAISECTFRNMKYLPDVLATPTVGAGGYGVCLQHSTGPTYDGTHLAVIEKCVFESTVYRHAIYIQSSKSCYIHNNTFYGIVSAVAGDHITGAEYFINSRGSSDMFITDNLFAGGVGAISLLQGNANYPQGYRVVIANNVIRDVYRNIVGDSSENRAIKVQNSRNVLISNNQIVNCTCGGITLDGDVDDVDIAGNFIECMINTYFVIGISGDQPSITNVRVKGNTLKTAGTGRAFSIDGGVATNAFTGFAFTHNKCYGGSIGFYMRYASFSGVDVSGNDFVGQSPAVMIVSPAGLTGRVVGNTGNANFGTLTGAVECYNNGSITFGAGMYPYRPIGGGQKAIPGTAAPTGGTWAVGDRVENTGPAAAGYIGWVCTAAGTPGTWKGYGLIQS